MSGLTPEDVDVAELQAGDREPATATATVMANPTLCYLPLVLRNRR